jgi:hypothetical protein
MKVKIEHVEKSTGLIRRTTHYGVSVHVEFNGEESAIIQQRGLEKDIVLERDYPSDVDAEKHEGKGLARKLAKAALAGADSLHFHLNVRKLRDGDTYFMSSPLEAKNYEAAVKEKLVELKAYILGNQGIEQKSDTFEI